ncbi:MAG: carbohydrate porin [Bacteroidales bacterium]|nr:carbohydrate porin [Bacteroidales bacterium]
MKIKYYSLFVITLFVSVNAQEDTIRKKVFEWEAGYVGDLSRNFDGGIKRGNTLMGVLSLGATIYTDRFWEGGKLYVQSMSTHGKGLSMYYVGDQQFISGIENDNYLFFMEKLYYRQNFNKGWITIGLQDLNQDFLVSEGGSHFTNSSFGIPSTYPLNFSAPIYPKTALAITAMCSFSDKWTLKTGVFDGDCGDLAKDRTNTKWKIHTHEGFLYVGELSYSPIEKIKVKAGGMYHTASFPDIADSTKSIRGTYGFHALIDYQLASSENQQLSCFTQFAYHPSKASNNTLYIGGGIVAKGYLFNRSDDYIGLGVACARFFDKSFECDIECNYCITVHQHVSIMPTFHYIINPGSSSSGLPNATAGILRIILSK